MDEIKIQIIKILRRLSAIEKKIPDKIRDGKDGRDGIDGIDGKDGERGPAGRDGIDGKDGYTPIKGVDYSDGEPGPVGPPGKNGKDGKPGRDGIDGSDGTPGKGIKSIKIDSGNLIITYTDGTTENLGKVKGRDGQNGYGGRGEDGKSAYDSAVEGGYTGTLEEFYTALANGGTGGSGHIIQKNGVSFAQREKLNFTGSVTVTDNGTDTTTVNITGGGGSSNTYFPSGW